MQNKLKLIKSDELFESEDIFPPEDEFAEVFLLETHSELQSAFIKGPISLMWAKKAFSHPKYKKAMVVTLLLFYHGLANGREFYVPTSWLRKWGISSSGYNLILNQLVNEGLINVTKGKGRKTRVKLIL
jgi:hypothetical protein